MKDQVTAAIFAGGASSRFGSPKANAQVDGEEFVVRIARSIRQTGIERVLLVGGSKADAKRWHLEFVEDETSDAGPLMALLSALHKIETEILLTMPCDVPWIDSETCNMISEFDLDFDLQVATTQVPQWLCSAWHRRTMTHLEQQFATGERAIHRAVTGLSVKFLQFAAKDLRNINTPDDLLE